MSVYLTVLKCGLKGQDECEKYKQILKYSYDPKKIFLCASSNKHTP